jgi:hypothetical protein
MTTTTAFIQGYDFGGGRTYKSLDQMSEKEFSDYLNKKNTVEQRKSLLGIGSSPSASASAAASSSGNASSLFGDLSSYTDQAKDLARFRLGLDQDQAKFSSGLRETEFESDFGRNYKLADQQIGGQYKLGEQQITGQKDLANIQQSATTDRLQRQLESQQGMQRTGFDQQNLYRAQSAALALRGLR